MGERRGDVTVAKDRTFIRNQPYATSRRTGARPAIARAGARPGPGGAPQRISVLRGAVDDSLRRHECLHQLFETSADLHADHTAIIDGDQRLTYRELEARANQLARHLVSRGVRRGRRVGIMLDRSIELYVSMLAAMKSGATYVPLDPGHPPDRVRYILEDAGIDAVITVSTLRSRHAVSGAVVALDAEAEIIGRQPPTRLDPDETRADGTDVCYIIYTSGSTGRPKGVQIAHRSVCHWVRAAQTIYQVTPEDRVYQGFTPTFDASVEEIWIALASGAALVPATPAMEQAGPELPRLLSAAGVTVLSCVPTLLSMFDEDVPSVRLLIFGGEVCPQQLVERWSRPGRRVVNTYGPTEATVTATCAECYPGRPVTIGRPLPNYTVYILDPHLRPVPVGQPGELCIGGIGLARGYVNRKDLTQEKFVPNPVEDGSGDAPRLYRTGDLARVTESGEIQFLGRVDSQVKIRGYRVELSEIETQLMAAPGVRAAAVTVHELTPGIPSLVAHVVPTEGTEPDEAALERMLRERLPDYMLPACIEPINELPTLPSGKVDRTRLPAPAGRRRTRDRAHVAPRTKLERAIADVWQSVFTCEAVSATAHFFHDLGGHSLFATLAASKLRANPALSDLSVSDIYRHPTVEALAQAIEERRTHRAPRAPEDRGQAPQPVSPRRYRIGGMLQAAGVYALHLLAFYPLLVLVLRQQGRDLSIGTLAATGLAAVLVYCPLTVVVSILVKWAIIGRFRAGRYPLWGPYYLRWWLVRHVQALVPLHLLTGTGLMPLYCRLMGARVGATCHIDTPFIQAFDLLTIGDHTSLNLDANLLGYTVEDGMLVIGPIEIGRDCFVGAHSVVCPGARLADGAQLGEHSMLPPGATIPSGHYWAGSPARRQDTSSLAEDFGRSALPTPPAPARRAGLAIAHVLLGMVLLPIVLLLAALPGGLVIVALYERIGYQSLLAAPLSAGLFIVSFCLETALLKWAVLGKISAGRYSLDSGVYLRKWFVDRLLQSNYVLLNSLFSTLYTLPYLRCLGANIGQNAEVERVSYVSPDLLTLHPESFIADAVYLGAPRVHRGQMLVGEARIGRRTFIGNSALIPAGQAVADRCLVGVQSLPPARTHPGTSWLGSPALLLPRRDVNRSFSETETYRPTRRVRAARYAVEFFRVMLPATFEVLMLGGAFFVARDLAARLTVAPMIAIFPAVMLTAQLLTTLLVVLVKLVVIGCYRPTVAPLWSHFVWRSELVTGLYESPAVQPFLNTLTGTPFLRWVWRLLGVKIGSRVFLDTTHVTEFDLVRIDDEAALNSNCGAQTHLFEDRVMKMSYLHIGPGCSIGSHSVVLYDSTMLAGSKLGSLSLLMKGESLPAATHWAGIPAESTAPQVRASAA